MPADTLTIADLVDLAAPPNAAVGALWLRRARHYAHSGLLGTDGPLHAGTGRHRRFGGEMVYIAALLFRLGSAGLTLPVLSAVVQTIKGEFRAPDDSPFKESWEIAKTGRDMHLGLMFSDPEATADSVPQLVHMEFLGDQLNHKTGLVPLHVINLGAVFGAVRSGLAARHPALLEQA